LKDNDDQRTRHINDSVHNQQGYKHYRLIQGIKSEY
jgi:hypothetical protein